MSDQGLQAVVLAAGRGSRMSELVNPSLIKCLIPVCGNPLIFYPLKFLATNKFKDILIIVQDREKEEVKRVVEKVGEKFNLNWELFPVPEDSEEFGTCYSLQLAYAAKKITRDSLIISSDTITDVSLHRFLNFYRGFDSDCTALFLNNLPAVAGKTPGPKSKLQSERDIVGIEEDSSKLVFLAPEADMDEDIALPLTTVRKCPHFKIVTWLKDSHIYLIRKRVLDKHLPNTSSTSVKGEFIPYLINSQFNDEEPNPVSVFAVSEPEKHCIRVNTVLNYATTCKSGNWLFRNFGIDIGPGASKASGTFSASAKLKAVVIGEGCILKDNVKITNSILMDAVEVEDGAVLENCIVASGAKIGQKCILKDCLVGPKHHVQDGGQFTNEFFSVSDESFF